MRYIDAEKLKKYLINRSFYPSIVKRAIEEALTEDVVPRAEVEELNWQLERERGYIEFLKTNLLKAKQDVARDIFREIGSFVSIGIRWLKELINDCDDDKKDYLLGRLNELCNIETTISNLEKKYIGE